MTAIPWPKSFSGTLVFLLDVTSRTELTVLEDYIRKTLQPEILYRKVKLSLRAKKLTKTDIKGIEKTVEKKDSDLYLIPLRVVWQLEKQESVPMGISFKGMLLGRRNNPSAVQQKIIHKSHFLRSEPPYMVIAGEGASIQDMEVRFHKNPIDSEFSRFIARSAFLALETAERGIRGARYKVPRMVDSEVLGSPQFKRQLEELSESSGRGQDTLMKEAADCLREMAATPTPKGLDLAAALGRYMYTRGFESEVDFAPGDLERVRELLRKQPVAFVFTHKSHIDGFFLITLFHDLNLPPVHTFGGINMGFMGLGTLLRNAGAIFIRRSFKGDDVYKLVFKSYIDYLGAKRFPLMWALEGTRSRTGKLMPPRYGLINYVVSAYLRDDSPDLLILPISIIYDQVPEVFDYDSLQAGGKKRPESASWFMQYISGLNNPHGRIHVRFGNGVKISDLVEFVPGKTAPGNREVQKIAFELAVDVNRVTPITVNSLVTYVLLEQGHKAITFIQLKEELKPLCEFIDLFKFPMTTEAADLNDNVIKLSLQQLSATSIIDIAEEGVETLYMIPYNGARRAAYYRNGLLHFFTTSAIGELALLSVTEKGEDAMAQFNRVALDIRDLLKYEFFFEGSGEFIESLEKEFDRRAVGWRKAVDGGPEAIQDLFRSLNSIMGQGTLRPVLESYLVFARALSLVPGDSDVDSKKLMADSLSLGKQRVLQQRIHCEESVSQSYFDNALIIAENKGLLAAGEDAAEMRMAWLEELRAIVNNVRFLASIMENRRRAAILGRQYEQLS